MRPPHYAGENRAVAGSADQFLYRFNEAPALRGGEQICALTIDVNGPASMRPPHYAGENSGVGAPHSPRQSLQ